GADNAVSVEVVVTVLANGTFNNTAVVKCDENETETNNSTNITAKDVILDITKVANATEVYVGENVTFTITVTNVGDADATNANISDKLDPNFAWVSGGSYDEDSHTVTWNIGTIQPGADNAVSVEVVVTVLANGTFNNTAVVKCDENETETNNSTNITVKQVILDITKVANATEVLVGDNITFTITVTNVGDGVGHNANVTDKLDPNFAWVSGGSYDEDSHTVTWNIGTIEPGADNAVSVEVVVTVLANGTFNNTAVVVCDENKTETNNSTNITAKQVVLEITKDVNTTVVVIGEEVEFTIVVKNTGDATATNVVVVDELPEGFTAVDFTSPYVIESLAPNANETIKITAVAVKAGEWTNVANVTCTENQTVKEANAKAVTVLRLNITISVGNYTTTPGTEVPVEITVVDQRGNPVTINLTVVVTGPDATDSLPPHEGKLVFTIATDLGADGEQVEVTNGKGEYKYKVPVTATNGTSYTVTASSEENDQYAAAKGTGYIDVIQYSTTTTISDASGKPGETVTLDVEVTTEDGTPFNGDVVITCPDGKKVTVTVKDGKGQFDWTIPEDAKAGDEYQFTATFEGNSTYLASSGNGTVTVEEPEPKPEPPVPVPVPEPEEPVVTPAKMLNTGNPLVALLAAFVLIGLGLKRREEE
ncbi:MAG: DUF11 domain-containing protein, partial [Methanobrevibacter olleyae]|nr:DUF11 domain-containing protein [Methanobrevibacter olleyae]